MQEYTKQYLEYLRIEKGLSEKSIDVYNRDIREFVHFVKNPAVNRLTRAHIRGFLLCLTKKNNQPITRRRKLTSLKSFFKFLENDGLITNNPIKNIPSPKVETKEPSYLTEAEIRKLWQTVKKDKSKFKERNKIMVRIFIETGMRLKELTGLNAGDIDNQEKTIKITRKRNKEQILPINAELNSMLRKFVKNRQPDDPLIISNRNKRMTNRRAGITVQKFIKLAKIEKSEISAHSLRHSFCVRLLEKGVNLKSIQILCGHKSIQTTERYLHIADFRLRKDAKLARID